ncbi:hypothetical protein D3C72_832510 [compost metagenome]
MNMTQEGGYKYGRFCTYDSREFSEHENQIIERDRLGEVDTNRPGVASAVVADRSSPYCCDN